MELERSSPEELALATSVPAVFTNKFVGMPGDHGLRISFIDEPGAGAPSVARASVLISWSDAPTLLAIVEESLKMLKARQNG